MINRHPTLTRRSAAPRRAAGPLTALRRRGLTLAESLLAMTILSVVLVAVLHATVAGHQHLSAGTHALDAGRLAEQLVEEARSRPYDGSGVGRAGYHLADYHGLVEQPGDVRDASGVLLDEPRQRFRRSVAVTDTTLQLNGLDNLPIPARLIVVTTEDDRGARHTLTAVVTEPGGP